MNQLQQAPYYIHYTPEFDQQYATEVPLGALYTKEQTTFRVWAPTAAKVELVVFEDLYGYEKDRYEMELKDNYYEQIISGDCHLLTYVYEITYQEEDQSLTQEVTMDPYSKAVTVNGQRSVVVDLSKTNPAGWDEEGRMEPFEDVSKAVIYEGSIRDFTMSPESGSSYPGKFLGLTEKGTTNTVGDSTGLDYLKELGITHVELLPFYDFDSVDETTIDAYNWGYDPLNYNVPDGTFAVNPYDPVGRIKEAKQMIQSLHDAGLRVIMDVVYNHVYEVESQSFHKIAPGYFFRHLKNGTLSNGTGVGNDTASERAMMRRYIVESVVYWAKEYKIDGFRFDLMGIHDVETMNQVRKALDEIDPSIIILGEGWILNTPLAPFDKANLENASQMPRIAHFNDKLREALKGSDFEKDSRGFVNGEWYQEVVVAEQMLGGNSKQFLSPLQLIQYIESHDNQTLYDKLKSADPDSSESELKRRHLLATASILLSQGIPFIHAGQEFLRTKQGVRDSYNQPDIINQLDWQMRSVHKDSVEFVKGLIALRRQEPLLRQTSYETIQQTSEIIRAAYEFVTLKLENETERIVIVLNAQGNVLNASIPAGEYQVLVKGSKVTLDDPTTINVTDRVAVDPDAVLVLKEQL